MTLSISWKIEQLERSLPDGGVFMVHWRANANDGDTKATVFNSVGFTPNPTSPSFNPFDYLTEQEVLGWVWGRVDRAEVELNLSEQIEWQKQPKTAKGLPWA
jgi:hypothetical protein